jgi:preprotein translocase subunit SecY
MDSPVHAQKLFIPSECEQCKKLSSSIQKTQQRIDAMLRVLALICVIVGGLFFYFAIQAVLIPQLVPIFYFMGGLLVFVGGVVLIVRFE